MATANKYCRPLVVEEIAGQFGFNKRWDLSYKDLLGVTIGANTTIAFTVGSVVAGDHLVQAHLHLTTAFSDASDSAFNSVTLDFGDTGSATRYLSGVQIDINGTEVIDSYLDPSGDYIYTAADSLLVTVHSMSAKDLTNIDIGKAYLEFTLLRHSALLKNPGA
jgi:hypothetical protein